METPCLRRVIDWTVVPVPCQLPKAKLEAVEVNKKQWGVGAEGGAAVTASATCARFLVSSALRNARACPSKVLRMGPEGRKRFSLKVFPAVLFTCHRPLRPRRLLLPRPRRPPKRLQPPRTDTLWAFLACPLTSPAPLSTALPATPLSRQHRLFVAPYFLSRSSFSMLPCVSCPVRRTGNSTMHVHSISSLRCRLLQQPTAVCCSDHAVHVCAPSVHCLLPGVQFLGMAGPRAAGHRDKFGGKHVCVPLPCPFSRL